MEVHAHSHSHGKKTWKNYFWEFLMLFLAVFCGFLAENQREHFVEHQREKQFIQTLLQDLGNDTVNFNRSISIFKSNVERFDSLKASVKNPRTQEDILNAYKASTLPQSFSSFNYSDRTIEQLRSAGNFRLIRNSAVSDALIEYDRYIRNTYLETEKILSEFDFLVIPTTPTTAFKIGEKKSDPLAMYLADLFTVQANLSGIPAISIPIYVLRI